ncbi:ATP-binding cassette domain-containing protein [Glutamicibacter sp.]|uniref:ATP-binding cassette domain-containing protein n=1 Tax=Glutamicibacter sp. TaxID=1931995 RepID=UPI0028BF384A|nr:ATP-binding cassette domain-containing protein [Glutamicibacter sp.]
MITLNNLSKVYGAKPAVDGLSLSIEPGLVTGFLGPNGAGKTTTMRMILGLEHPTAGSAMIHQKPYDQWDYPLRTVGAHINANAGHPGRTPRTFLKALSQSNRIPSSRIDVVLEAAGLSAVEGDRIRGFSLGMRQRLGIAAALLGDPEILIFDEPMNGLDAEGIRWIRDLMRQHANDGGTVFVSSHLMSEMQQVADQLVVIGRGKLITQAPMQELLEIGGGAQIIVKSPDSGRLKAALESERLTVIVQAHDELLISGGTLHDVGAVAYRAGCELHELSTRTSSLENIYTQLTQEAVEYSAQER